MSRATFYYLLPLDEQPAVHLWAEAEGELLRMINLGRILVELSLTMRGRFYYLPRWPTEYALEDEYLYDDAISSILAAADMAGFDAGLVLPGAVERAADFTEDDVSQVVQLGRLLLLFDTLGLDYAPQIVTTELVALDEADPYVYALSCLLVHADEMELDVDDLCGMAVDHQQYAKDEAQDAADRCRGGAEPPGEEDESSEPHG